MLSIITVTYNSAATLRDTFDSVLRQHYKDVDYCVVDGGSTDGTLEIIREYAGRFGGRMRWMSEPDKGIYDAMNKGLRMVRGEYVGILNSDDFYSADDVLEKAVEMLERTGVDAVYGDVHYVHPDDLTRSTRYYSSRVFRRGLMRFGFMPAHPSFYCRRSVYERYGLFSLDYAVAADFECLLRFIYVHRIRTAYLPMDFVTMRSGGASSSGWQSWLRIMKDHKRALAEHGICSNTLLLSLRYIYKVYEKLFYRGGR
ncbi:MAG: glycosyltransferase [Clostridium sp.]|nr:glycosyltransferase [Clostridium sp.]